MLYKASTVSTYYWYQNEKIEDNMQWDNLFQSFLHAFHLYFKMTYYWVA